MQSMNSDEIDHNLRLFAMRKAAAASKEFSDLSSRVVVSIQSNTNTNCPMHGKHGTFHQQQQQQPQQQQYHTSTEQHVSRKEFCKELRLMANRPGSAEVTTRRSNSLAIDRSFSRSQSVEPSYQSNSMPRRMSSTAATKNNSLFRNGSFQEPPYKAPPAKPAPKPIIREKYTGRVDFKNILRRFDPKEEERSSGGRYDGEPRDYHRDSQFQHHMLTQNPYASPHRGATATHVSELEFNFRGSSNTMSPSSRNGGTDSPNSRSGSLSVRSLSPRRPQNLDLDLNSLRRGTRQGPDLLRSPDGGRRAESNPHSPRRVEFADQVMFTFSQEDLQKQFQRNTMGPAKPILRQSRHDQQEQSPQQLTLMQQFELQQQQLQQQQQQQQQQHLNNNNNNHYKTTVIPLVIEHANLDRVATSSRRTENDPVNQRKVSNGDSLVQIYVPPTRKSDADSSLYNSSEDETLSAGSQDEENRTDDFSQSQNDETHETSSNRPKLGLNFLRTLSVEPSSSSSPVEEEGKNNRKIPPPLSDWNRSQSFPPPGKSFVTSEAGQKVEDESSARGNVFGGRPLSKGIPSVASSVLSCNSDIEDDMVENENETLRDRVSDLEKKVHDQNDEITCLRATLADALRRINHLETGKAHVQVNHVGHAGSVGGRDVRLRSRDMPDGMLRLGRRPVSVTYSSPHYSPHTAAVGGDGSGQGGPGTPNNSAHENVARRTGIYQSTGSLHSDGLSSNSMSPTASPSPTHLRGANQRPSNQQLHMSPAGAGANPATAASPSSATSPRNLSNSMSNLNMSGARKWGSTSDFRDQSPGPNNAQAMARRLQVGSMHSLRSPYGSQHNLDRAINRHGTKDATYNPDDGFVKMYIRGRPVQLYAPSPLIETYSLSKVSPAPHQKPKLEWVYGYRGKDARTNLYLLPTGEMVYFVAAVVVLFNAEEHSQRHYLGHTEDIKCLVVHPNKLLIATGQTTGHDRREGRPHIRIWNSVSLQTLHVLGIGDFERSVCCVSFSKADGGNLLVAVDEGQEHTMSVWDWQRGERGSKITETKCATETVVAAEFHPLEAGVIVTIGKGHVNFWTLDNTSLTLSRKTGLFDQRDKPKYVTCLAFSFTGDVITGDSNGNVFIWGRGYNAVTKALRKVHDGPIFAICVLKDGSVVTGGGKDRRLVQFDASYRKSGLEAELPEHLGSVRTISQGKGSQLLLGSTRNSILQGTFELNFQEIVTGHVDEVWALATHPQQNQFLSASYDQFIHLWDTLTHRTIWSSNIGDQAQTACFSSDGEVIVIGMTSGKWMVLDSNTREVFGLFQDGTDAIQVAKFSPDGKLLALGSRDGIIYMYQVTDKYRKYSRMGRCMADSRRRRAASSGSLNTLVQGQSNCLTHLDWSTDSTYIQSNSGDFELLFWNASICRQITNPASVRDVTWASQSCLLSFNTIGVWPETIDGTDLNTCARSNNHKFVATGDDFGKIKLYSYPVTQPKSLYHVCGGHSSQVTRVEFLPDDNRLISTGGRDTAIMQWVIS